MPRVHFGVISEIPRKSRGMPSMYLGHSDRSNPHFNHTTTPRYAKKGYFAAPIGIVKTKTKYQSVVSVFREADLPEMKARIIEYHQYVMQRISILLILPASQMTALEDFHLRTKGEVNPFRKQLPSIVDKMTEKYMSVTVPSSVHRQLEKAKIKVKFLSQLADREMHHEVAPADSIAVVNEFKIDGPFVILVYDHTKKSVYCLTRVFRIDESFGGMNKVIKEIRKRDELLAIKRLTSTSNTEGTFNEEGRDSEEERQQERLRAIFEDDSPRNVSHRPKVRFADLHSKEQTVTTESDDDEIDSDEEVSRVTGEASEYDSTDNEGASSDGESSVIQVIRGVKVVQKAQVLDRSASEPAKNASTGTTKDAPATSMNKINPAQNDAAIPQVKKLIARKTASEVTTKAVVRTTPNVLPRSTASAGKGTPNAPTSPRIASQKALTNKAPRREPRETPQ